MRNLRPTDLDYSLTSSDVGPTDSPDEGTSPGESYLPGAISASYKMSGFREYRAAARAVADRKRFFRDSELFAGEARAVIWFVVACMVAAAAASVWL